MEYHPLNEEYEFSRLCHIGFGVIYQPSLAAQMDFYEYADIVHTSSEARRFAVMVRTGVSDYRASTTVQIANIIKKLDTRRATKSMRVAAAFTCTMGRPWSSKIIKSAVSAVRKRRLLPKPTIRRWNRVRRMVRSLAIANYWYRETLQRTFTRDLNESLTDVRRLFAS